ncbi:DUF5610 domain-containing protein [Marinobacterium rhizophilum]|uniref:DUF5610 domain-containing protein n=1 Tax=Marinobacterium rhizophilum TaxID=420402 RepID=UPI0003698978|nr:DUF5610 domain-containing protein [Marinobacterium rhizophilum]
MDIKPDNFGQKVAAHARAQDRPGGGIGEEVSHAARTDKQLAPTEQSQSRNQAILAASLKVSIAAGSQPMEMLYRGVIDTLNAELKTDLGDTPLQTAYATQLDVSPKTTAMRILSRATGFFESYRAQHAQLNENDARARFTDLLRSGVIQGFDQARDILQGLGVLETDIASAIDATYTLVMQGLNAFQTPSQAAVDQELRPASTAD